MATRCMDIDIGTSSIKVVEMLAHSKTYSLNWANEYKLSLNPAHDPDIEILEILREILTRFDPSSSRIVLGVPQENVALRKKLFPFTERLKILKSLIFELEDEIPLTFENAVFEAKVLRYFGPQAEVLAMAAPKTAIKTVLQRCLDAGFTPTLVSAEGTAFANCLERWWDAPPLLPAITPQLEEVGPPPTDLQMILHLGHTKSFLTVYENRVLMAIRTLAWGGRQIVEAVAQKYNLPFAEAQREVEAKAFILTSKQQDIKNFDVRVFSDTIAKVVKDLAHEVQLHVLEMRSEFNARSVQMDLTGGVSNLQGLCPFLTQNLEIPVNRLDLLDLFSNVYFDKTEQAQAKLGVAVGLAIEAVKKPRNPPANFLKGEFAPQNNFWKTFSNRWGYAVQIGVAAYLTFLGYSYLRDGFAATLSYRVEDALKDQAQAVARLPARQATVSGVEKFIREKRKVITELNTLAQLTEMNSALEFLKRLSESTPAREQAQVELARFHILDETLQIMGYAANQKSQTLLQNALQALSLDGKVKTIPSTAPQKASQLSFGYEVKVNRNAGKTK